MDYRATEERGRSGAEQEKKEKMYVVWALVVWVLFFMDITSDLRLVVRHMVANLLIVNVQVGVSLYLKSSQKMFIH